MLEEGCLLRMGMAIHERNSKSIGFFFFQSGEARGVRVALAQGEEVVYYTTLLWTCAREKKFNGHFCVQLQYD